MSLIRKNFKEAFDGEVTPINTQSNDRLAQLEEQVKEMRAKFKKEESSRKQY